MLCNNVTLLYSGRLLGPLAISFFLNVVISKAFAWDGILARDSINSPVTGLWRTIEGPDGILGRHNGP
jgi:hypothetical protein